MKILLTNFQLHSRAGSELLTLEVATGLLQMGHEVRIFSLEPGKLALGKLARGIGVFSLGDEQKILTFSPDVILANHWPTLVFLRLIGISCPSALSCLGTIPKLERSPSAKNRAFIGWAISEETQRFHSKNLGGNSVSLVRNWYPPDSKSYLGDVSKAKGKILVVSNRMPVPYMTLIYESAQSLGLEVTKIGKPERSVKITDALLSQYAAVITIARTAIHSTSLGIPTLLLDQSGLDGWVLKNNVGELAEYNFSGRLHREVPTKQKLVRLLDQFPTTQDLESVRQFAQDELNPQKNIRMLENIALRAISEESFEEFDQTYGNLLGALLEEQGGRFLAKNILRRLVRLSS